MRPALDTPDTDYLARIRSIAPAIEDAAADIDSRRDLPDELKSALIENEFFRMLLPRSMGGGEVSPGALARLMEELARSDASVAWCIGQTSVCATIAVYLAPPIAKTIFGPRHGILAWGPGKGEARETEGGYRLSGTFHFASGSRLATWLGAHVPVLHADGTPRTDKNGEALVRTLLFPKSQAEIQDTWHVIGLRGTGSDSYVVRDLFVPATHAVTRDLAELPPTAGKLYLFTQSTLYASAFAGIALGIAGAMLQAFIDLAGRKVPRGARHVLRDNNVVQAKVGHSEARLRAARKYLQGTLDELWHEREAGEMLSLDELAAIRLATTWSIQQAREVTAVIYNVAGATAVFESQPFERRFRDMNALSQQIQSHEAHFETVGLLLLGGEPDRKMFTF